MISCHCQGVLMLWRHADDSESTWFRIQDKIISIVRFWFSTGTWDLFRIEIWLPLAMIRIRGFEPMRLWNPFFSWLWFESRDSNPCVSGTHSSPDYDSNPGIRTHASLELILPLTMIRTPGIRTHASLEPILPLTMIRTPGFEPMRLWNSFFPWLWFEHQGFEPMRLWNPISSELQGRQSVWPRWQSAWTK